MLKELVTRNILGWVYMVCPGMAVVCGTKSLGNLADLIIFVKQVEEFNKQSALKKQEGFGFVCLRGWYCPSTS